MTLKTDTINFFKEGVNFRLIKKEKLNNWLTRQVKKEGFKISCINFIFCSDIYLRKINKEYLQHDYFTDIVTFDNSVFKKEITGDIFISIDRLRINAGIFKVSFNDELNRVMAHGVLHLLGYSDKNEKQKTIMKKMEDQWLKARKFQ